MSYFTDTNFDSLISSASRESRGDHAIIDKMKADIKAFSEKAHIENIEWRRYTSKLARGLKTWSYNDPDRPSITTPCSDYMRHLFLAYGFIRFKPWEKIESKTVKSRGCTVKVNGKWLTGSAPDARIINAIIDTYRDQIAKEVLSVAKA